MRIRKPLTPEQKAKAKERLRLYRIANRERLNETDRKRYLERRERLLAQQAKKYKENPEKKKEVSREWRKNNIEKIKAYQKQYRLDHKKERAEYDEKRSPEENSKRACQWAKDHPVEMRLRNAARRAKTKGVKINKEEICNWDTRICGICSDIIEDKFHIDHIVPLSKGGPHEVSNLQLAHQQCNNKKYNKLIEEIYASK